MQVIRFANFESLSEYAATIIAAAIKNKPTLTFCMASGHTPALTCDLLVQKIKAENIDCGAITFIGLDEWVGLPPTNTGSCSYFFTTKLFEPLQLQPSQYFIFNAMAQDLQSECAMMDAGIKKVSGIDIMLVGIGMNGHVGFNEPGTAFTSLCHVAELDDTTKTVGQKYFTATIELYKGITIGLQHLQNAKQVFLLANGSKKAAVIRATVEGTITENFPASIMQQHTNGFVLIDEEAAVLLNPAN